MEKLSQDAKSSVRIMRTTLRPEMHQIILPKIKPI